MAYIKTVQFIIMENKASRPISRRHFIGTAAAAFTLPLILPGCASSAFSRRTSPSNRINMAMIGTGWQGTGNMEGFLNEPACQVIAICDLDKDHLQNAVNKVNDHYQTKDCASYHDYREVLAREDIDAVMIATPDHWHALVAVEAARRKKDIYGEKPLAKTLAEQQAIVRACQKNKVIWQMGSWQRSVPTFHKAAEIVRNGLIGEVTRVEVGLPSGWADFANTKQYTQITEPPPELDYEMWIGPAQMEPYIKARSHKNWRWNYNTGGGQLMDWVGHHCDIAHWGLGFDGTGPSEIEGTAEFPPPTAVWNTSPRYRIELKYLGSVTKYPRDITMIMAGGYDDIRGGVKWIGTNGWVWVDRGGFDASNPDWKKGRNLPEELRKVKLYSSDNHTRNFLECIKSRQPTITPVEVGHRSASAGHLGYIATRTGRKIRWDPVAEKIVGDPEASKLLGREYRSPWKLS